MMLDDDDCVAVTAETKEYFDELVDVSQGESGSWLVEDVHSVFPRGAM
jgi:hypothetical protein